MTYHVVIAFDRDAEGDLKPVKLGGHSPIVVERRARARLDPAAGVVSGRRRSRILAQFGEVDLDSLGGVRGTAVISRTALANQEPSSILR